MRTWIAAVACLALAGCQSCKNILQPDHVDADLATACTTSATCASGLACIAGTCGAPGSVGLGDACSAARDCGSGLTCTEAGTCAPVGTGAVGAACTSIVDCATGLACVHEGFGGTCAMPGAIDLGGACNASAQCLAGLVCGSDDTCAPPAAAYPPFAGVTCAPDQTTFSAFFEIPRGGPLADFYRLPFPSDVRVKADGTLDLKSFPRPGKTLLGVDVVDLYATALAEDFAGYSTLAPVTFRFTSELGFDSIAGGANLHYVDITTPGDPGYGVDVSRTWSYDTGRHQLICQHALVVANAPAAPLRAHHTYAVYLTTAITSKAGVAPTVPADLTLMLGASAPSDPILAAAWQKHAPFRTYLAQKAIDPNTIATAAVFTVGDPAARMQAVAKATLAAPAPTLTDLTLCDGTAVSPCAGPGGRACGAPNADYYEIHGRFTEPSFQAGTAPFATVADGGAIAYAPDGTPTVQATQAVCFALTIPKTALANVPLVIHAHGTGGSFESAIADGIATALARAPTPMATLTYDGVVHGARANGSTRSTDSLVFNLINPRAARDNHLQGGADVVQLARVAQLAPFTVAGVTGTISFDPARTYFFGHSQGSNVGLLGVPESPHLAAAVFSGAGSDLALGILGKTSPQPAKAGLELVLGEAVGGGHPFMILLQTFFDPIDPANHVARLVRTPPTGVASKHVLQTWSATDTYAPKATLTATAQVGGFSLAAPPTGSVIEAIATVDPRPITAAVAAGDGKTRFATVFEYATDGSYDGHFVATEHPQAIADWTAFFASLAAGGSPTVP